MCAAKKSGVTRRRVASSATAFAPFSQNSAVCRCSGSGQAQPGQSKPSFWLTRRRVERGAAHAHLLLGDAQGVPDRGQPGGGVLRLGDLRRVLNRIALGRLAGHRSDPFATCEYVRPRVSMPRTAPILARGA